MAQGVGARRGYWRGAKRGRWENFVQSVVLVFVVLFGAVRVVL